MKEIDFRYNRVLGKYEVHTETGESRVIDDPMEYVEGVYAESGTPFTPEKRRMYESHFRR